MSIHIDIKINAKPIYRISAHRQSGTKPEGTNAYKCRCVPLEEGNGEAFEFLIAHTYEDGALKLTERIVHEAISTPRRNTQKVSS